MTCYPSSTSLCWVCGLEECPHEENNQSTNTMSNRIYLNLDCMDAERGLPSYPDKYFDLAITLCILAE